MRMISSTLIILRDPVRPVHKLGEPLESAIVPCCFGVFPSLERTAASDISHYKHIAFARLLKAQCLFDSTFFSQSMRQTDIRRPTLLPSGMFPPKARTRPSHSRCSEGRRSPSNINFSEWG